MLDRTLIPVGKCVQERERPRSRWMQNFDACLACVSTSLLTATQVFHKYPSLPSYLHSQPLMPYESPLAAPSPRSNFASVGSTPQEAPSSSTTSGELRPPTRHCASRVGSSLPEWWRGA